MKCEFKEVTNMQKYEIITDQEDENYGHIRALIDFGSIRKGNIGGKIDKYDNLSQEGDCWVYINAEVRDNAKVCDSAWVFGFAKVYGDAKVYGNARVYDFAEVYGNATVYDFAWVYGHARVYSNAKVFGDDDVRDNAEVRI